MKIGTLLVASAWFAAGCYTSPEEQAEEVREEAVDVIEEAREVPEAGSPEEQIEEQVDVAEAREDLVAEMREMADVLQSYGEREELTPAAREELVRLQTRYQELAQRIEAAGADPDVLRELKDVVQEMNEDVEAYGNQLGGT